MALPKRRDRKPVNVASPDVEVKSSHAKLKTLVGIITAIAGIIAKSPELRKQLVKYGNLLLGKLLAARAAGGPNVSKARQSVLDRVPRRQKQSLLLDDTLLEAQTYRGAAEAAAAQRKAADRL